MVPALPSHDPDGWRAMCAVVRHLERDVRGALLDVSDDAVNAAQLRSWGACLAPCDLARIPLAFRGVAPPSDPRLDSTPEQSAGASQFPRPWDCRPRKDPLPRATPSVIS